MIFPSSLTDALMAAFPNRTWKAIILRSWRLKLRRQNIKIEHWQRWTPEEDDRLQRFCLDGVPYEEIARELDRSVYSVTTRVRDKGFSAYRQGEKLSSRIDWETYDLISSQELPSRGGHRG